MDPQELFPWLFGGGMVLTVITILIGVVVSLLCTILPFVAVFWYIKKRSDQAGAMRQASQAWQTTTGRILKSRVEVSGGDHATVTPYILYEYEVYGRPYQSQQIKAGDQFMRTYSSRSAYDTADRYPVGATVTVYYDPADPQQSALER